MAMAMAMASSIFLLLLLFPIFTSSQNITVGTSLTAAQSSNPWQSSPNGDYAFGFQQLQNSTDQFILSIWLDKIPNKTIVWYERTSYPVPRGSTLRLDASDGLALEDPQGNRLYTSSTGGGAGYASMNDTGNLVIFGSDSSVLWESFRHPTDTILPTQTIEIGDALISRRTESDYSAGRFYASISDSGNFVFNTKSVPSNSDYDDEYYSSFTSSDNASDAGVRVALSGGALISLVRRNGGEQVLSPRSPPSPSDNYYRAILEFDGVFRLYYHPKSSGDNPTWQVAGSWPDNICVNVNGGRGSGACGYNSVCRIENQRPVCECPKGFSLADPTNPSGDCKPNSVQSCISGENGDEYKLEVITDTDWPRNDYQQIDPSSEDQCRSSCLDDCLCGVAIYRSNSCWKKKLPLSNGRVDTTLGVKAFLKMRKTPLSENITVGTSLTAAQNSNPWRSSPNGDFAFGFQRLQNSSDQFILSIWLDKIPNKTIVWYERTTYPVPRGSTLRLDASDGLLLEDPQGRRLYSTSTGGGAANRVGYASMNDTGNFVIFGSDDSSVLWESFRHPADTILPTQILEINETLISRRTESDFSMGRFYAFISDSGNFVFNTKSVPSNSDYDDEYYSSLTSSQNASDGGVRVAFSGGALISVVRRSGAAQILSSRSIPLPSDNYYRAILEFDGVFRLYYHPKNSGDNPTWQVAGSWPDNICLNVNEEKGSGACGYNSVCSIENRRPVCECPKGFSLADPSNINGDCKPRFARGCIDGEETSSPEDVYDLEVITDTDWPRNDYQQINPSSEDQCRSSCLNDCFCGVAIYRNHSCWKKKLPLSNGRVIFGSKTFLKLRKSDLPLLNPTPPNPARRHRQGLIVLISVLLGSSAFVNFLLITAACLLLFLVYKKKSSPSNPVQDSNLRCFTYKELVQATNGFKEELGRGAFGIVYKGTMVASSETRIAVKKLDRMFQDSEKEFETEVNAIGQTHHKNLVGLIAFCNEGPHRLLVYEYMSNGTLAAFLFGDPKPSWSQRARMAVGIAKGLAYLHEECSTQIIHCDIKPQNILLDEYYTPRISDFGLAKLLTMNQSKTLTNIRGTKGYVAPEWFRNTQISVKVDVYSFGVVLLEIVSCRRMLEDLEVENPILTDWAWDCLVERKLDALVEEDEEALKDREMVERFIKVGLWCVEEDADLRPTMIKACQMLEGIVQVPEPSIPHSFTS